MCKVVHVFVSDDDGRVVRDLERTMTDNEETVETFSPETEALIEKLSQVKQ